MSEATAAQPAVVVQISEMPAYVVLCTPGHINIVKVVSQGSGFESISSLTLDNYLRLLPEDLMQTMLNEALKDSANPLPIALDLVLRRKLPTVRHLVSPKGVIEVWLGAQPPYVDCTANYIVLERTGENRDQLSITVRFNGYRVVTTEIEFIQSEVTYDELFIRTSILNSAQPFYLKDPQKVADMLIAIAELAWGPVPND